MAAAGARAPLTAIARLALTLALAAHTMAAAAAPDDRPPARTPDAAPAPGALWPFDALPQAVPVVPAPEPGRGVGPAAGPAVADHASRLPGLREAASAPQGRAARADDDRLVWLGRWEVTPQGATTVNSGARLVLAFTGTSVTLLLGTTGITRPAQVYTSVDGGPPVLHTVAADRLRVPAGAGGRHVLEVAVKDVDERANRWMPPLQSALVISGVQLEPGQGLLPPPALGTRRIAFFGDSITQGSRLVRAGRGPGGGDGTLAYPALTASAFRARALQVGFGGQGLLVPGVGSVPPAAVTLDRVFAGVADDGSFAPDVVVVNQGTNDVRASAVAFRAAYLVYLRRVRELYPRAEILALRPLVGRHADDVRAAVSALRDPRARYVDTTGWLGRGELNDSVHPNARGHARVAARLTAVVAAVTGWRPQRPRWSALPTPAPAPGPGGPSPADLS